MQWLQPHLTQRKFKVKLMHFCLSNQVLTKCNEYLCITELIYCKPSNRPSKGKGDEAVS